MHYCFATVFLLLTVRVLEGCNFYPVGEYLRFVRIPENLKVGGEVLKIEVHPRKNLNLQAVEKAEDAHYFTYRDVNRTHVSVILAQSLDKLVDSDNPQNVLKFRLGCDYDDGDDLVSAYLSVTVYVEDINDHAPVFQGTPYLVSVEELTPVGVTIFKSINAFDRDKPNTPNSDVQYSITNGNVRELFALDSSHKGQLVLKKPLDYDGGDKEFQLTVTATDRGSPPRSTNITVHVFVHDNDDLGPKFTQPVYKTQIPEFYPSTGKKIHKELTFKESIFAFDQDLGLNVPVRYEIVSGNEQQLFAINPVNGSLFLKNEIDLDEEVSLPANTFVLQIQAAQTDNPLKADQARVEVEILDLNDNLPQFEVDFYNISIVENLPNGFSVLQVMATDKDQGDNGEFTFLLADPYNAFSIDPRSGWLTVRDQTVLDREKHATLRMKVYAKEKNPSIVGAHLQNQSRGSKWRGYQKPTPFHKEKTTYIFPDQVKSDANVEFFEETKELMAFVTVEVTLLDANDNNPVFLPSNLYEFNIKSNAKVGTFIGRVKAIDPDLGRNGMVLYDIQRTSNLTITSPFVVDAQTGAITLTESQLVEGRHALFVEASDQPANPSERRYSLAVVTIDVNPPSKGQRPERPDFIGAPYEFWVGANVGVGTSVGQVRVNDAFDKSQVVYDLLHGYPEGVPFAVEERSGVITVIDRLSRYNHPIYEFEAVAQQDNINVTLVTNATVHVVDVNDERGVLFKSTHSPIVFHVKENSAGAIIGRVIDANFTLPANLSKNVRFFIANQQDVTDDIAIAQDGTLYAQKALDREKRDTYRLTIIAEYNKGLISGAGIYQVTVNVDDENDNAPKFDRSEYEGQILENAQEGEEVILTYPIKIVDPDLGINSVFTLSLTGDGHHLFQLHEGKVKYIGKKLDREEVSSFILKIMARDRGGISSEAKLKIDVIDENDNAPEISRLVLPAGENIEVIEAVENSKIKIYKEKKNDFSSQLSHIEVRPRNKIALVAKNLGFLFSLPENILIGSAVMRIEAKDLDVGINGDIKYDFLSEVFIPKYSTVQQNSNPKRYFVINERQGQIIVAKKLPAESEFRLNISVCDTFGKSDNISIRFSILDVNDHGPMFKKSWYSFNVDESVYSHRVLGKIDATDMDYGNNANISYFIFPKKPDLPFEISPLSGVFSVHGELDREKQDRYILQVIAKDNGAEKQLTSSVSVEIQVLDVNDNVPKFYGYDELLEWKHPEAEAYANHNFESVMMIPVYRASLDEMAPVGSYVTRVYANDSDFAGNGNGLLLYNLPQRKNQVNIFAIDSKEGIITTTGKLDYESQSMHNVTIIASDLGSPSLSSTALLILTVTDVADEIELSDKPVFINRYFEVEIEENSLTPVELLTLNLTEHYENYKMKYSLIGREDSKKMFLVDPRNGTVYMIRSPDREIKDRHEVIVRAEKQKISRNLPHMVYPVSDSVLEGMSKYEVKIVVKVKDVNDNSPKFLKSGRPMVTAIPTTAVFGYQVIKLQATDADEGINADIRYQIINDHSQRFAIDPLSGQVRAVASFLRDAGRVFGFDVKATDKRGADDGRSAIANVFVYVLDDNKQLVMVLGMPPTEVESELDNITQALSGVTGFDIRVRQMESHSANSIDDDATDIYVYAVDPMSNSIIDMDVLQRSLLKRETDLRHELASYKILEVGDKTIAQARQGRRLSSVEISVVTLACVVFVGALIASLCVLCVRKNKRRKNTTQHRLNTMAFSNEQLTKIGALFPSGNNQIKELNSYSEADSYMDVLSSARKVCPHGNTIEEFGKAHQKCVKNQFGSEFAASDMLGHKHEKNCIKFNQKGIGKKRKVTKLETSINSVHSSGQDSGIAEGAPCACGISPSEESSGGSYEDSLKSNQKKLLNSRIKPYHLHPFEAERELRKYPRRASIGYDPFDLRRYNNTRQSFSDLSKAKNFGRRQMSNPNLSTLSPVLNNYVQPNNRRKESYRDEPVIDYDMSDIDDERGWRSRARFLEVGAQGAVFVATPAAAAIMRRRTSDRFAMPGR